MLRWLKKRFGGKESVALPDLPITLQPEQHKINPQLLDRHAVSVVATLQKAGFSTYIVGGSVRDLLLQHRPKDFDVATNAEPEEVRRLFRNSRIIGKRFRLVHVRFGREIIEVATFRGGSEDAPQHRSDDGMILRDNVFGTLEEDAWRRDFTINALYYDPIAQTVIDYVGGLASVQQRSIDSIGDAAVRFREDPVRMIRAVRFAAKIGFDISADAQQAIHSCRNLIDGVSSARLFDEVVKLFLTGHGVVSYQLMQQYQLLDLIYPTLNSHIGSFPEANRFIEVALRNSDNRIAEGKSVTPAFLLATMFWCLVKHKADTSNAKGGAYIQALQQAGDEILNRQQKVTSGPRRFLTFAQEIWSLQHRLILCRTPFKLFEHPRFRAAYDFLLLRYQAGDDSLQQITEWWTEYQQQSATGRKTMEQQRQKGVRGRKPRRRGPGRRQPVSDEGGGNGSSE